MPGVEYNIYEEPQTQKPIADKQKQDKQKAVKAPAENRQQLNTNQLKYLKDKIFMLLNTNDTELLGLYSDYIEMRANINAPLTENGIEALIERVNRLSKNNVRVQKLLLENAIINNWKNVYLPRETELQALNVDMQEELKSLLGLE